MIYFLWNEMIKQIMISNCLGGIFGFLFVLSAILLIVFLLKKKKRKQIGKRNVENKELNQLQLQSQSQSQYETKSQSMSQSNQNFPATQYSQSAEPQQSQNSERRESTIVLMKTLVPTKVYHFFQIITQLI